jgi:hypothetical protein
MVGTLLWSMATAVGRGRDVLWRLDPERAWRAELEEQLTSIREQVGVFPLLVPEGWSGGLSLDADWSIPARGPRVLRGVVVVADQGDPLLDPDRQMPGRRPSTPRVEIRYSTIPWDVAEAQALNAFVERALAASQADLDAVEQADRQVLERRMLAAERDCEQQRQQWAAELADRWRHGHVDIDGVAITGRLLTHDDADVGVATFVHEGQGVLLIAEGIDLDTLTLIGVTDPTLLIDEFERRRRRIFTPPDG